MPEHISLVAVERFVDPLTVFNRRPVPFDPSRLVLVSTPARARTPYEEKNDQRKNPYEQATA
jgi:hypothetical protein